MSFYPEIRYVKKLALIGLACVFLFCRAEGQTFSEGQQKELEVAEDSLNSLMEKMNTPDDVEARQKASEKYIPLLVRALQTKNSFYFLFDKLKGVSILKDGEETFRIFSWGIPIYDNYFRFFGALQKKTEDGSLQLYPFFDGTPFIKDKDTITDRKVWPGAAYYDMVETEAEGEVFYTLIGWKGFTATTSTKVLEVLHFKDGEPVFGFPLFNYEKDSVDGGVKNRFLIEYKKDGRVGLNYDEEMDLIIYDHLTSLRGTPEDSSTLVADGTYSGFEWKNGNWVHIEKIFSEESEEAPRPEPLKRRGRIEGNKNY